MQTTITHLKVLKGCKNHRTPSLNLDFDEIVCESSAKPPRHKIFMGAPVRACITVMSTKSIIAKYIQTLNTQPTIHPPPPQKKDCEWKHK